VRASGDVLTGLLAAIWTPTVDTLEFGGHATVSGNADESSCDGIPTPGTCAAQLGRDDYDASRWIIEPFFHLYDCCLENDGAAAVVVVSADRAKDFPRKPAYLLGAVQGCDHRSAAPVHNMPGYPSSHFRSLAPHLYRMAELGPSDMGVVQCYENFTGGVLMSLVEHGFCSPDEANEFCTVENLTWPQGKLPINTSGGNLAECYMHGLELITEAVRQIRGTSTCQVQDCRISLVASGPMVSPVSSLILRA